jgi:microcystin-dependent protein
MSGEVKLDGITLATESEGTVTIDSEVNLGDVVIPAENVVGELSGVTGTTNSTTKGDLETYSTEPTRLPVGADDDVLTADSTDPRGIAWKANSSAGSGVPPGMIAPFAMSTVPEGWLTCNGTSYLIEGIYNDLYLAIGVYWGGTAQSHFNVPNLVGAYLRGTGTNSLSPWNAPWAGPSVGGYHSPQLLDHAHTISTENLDHTHTHTLSGLGHRAIHNSPGSGNQYGTNRYVGGTTSNPSPSLANHSHTITGTTPGGSDLRVFSKGIVWMIKY